MGRSTVFRRRSYLINKGLQSRFIITFALIVVVGFLLSWFLVYYMVDKELAVELYKSHIKIRTTGEIIRPILIRLNIIVLPFIIAIASIAVILLTRVIEIPLGDFKEVVRDFEGGSFGRRFSGDVPDKLSTGFNNMADEYEGTFITLKSHLRSMEKEVVRFEDLIKGEKFPIEDLKGIAGHIGDFRERLDKEVSKFRV